jgi:hypothetical protein
MKRFKHSGAFGDLIYSLPLVKHFGGGEFYLHLNQINWIGMHYYGSPPNSMHQGRLTVKDFEFMKSFMETQEYITKFDIMNSSVEITHNLDKFRPAFVGHPGNYVNIYSSVFGINDPSQQLIIRNTPWITVPNSKKVDGRPIVINRTARWTPRNLSVQWLHWQVEGLDQQSIFVGLPEEYELFKKVIGWNIPYQPTKDMLELAEYISGSQMFIGNQSLSLSLAIGLGVNTICEARDDLPLERNECYFPNRENVKYF